MNGSRLTIRARITGGSLLIAVLISIVAGIIIYGQVGRIVRQGSISVLESAASPYVAAIEAGDTQEWDPPGPGQFVAVIAPTGAVVLDTLPADLDAEALATTTDGASVVAAHLVQTTTVDAEGGAWGVVTAVADDRQVLNEVAFLLIASIAGINLAFGAASWLISTAALRPVSRLRRSAAEIASAPGRELLPVGPAQDEISDLAQTLNQLIAELRASADRERQIVSDASHELRTPLAILQTRLELALRQADTLEKMRGDVDAARKTVARLSALANSLLELSRIDAQAEPGRATVGELAAELGDAVDRGRQRVSGRNIRIDYVDDTTSRDDQVAVGDADFGRVCDNLIGNSLAAIDTTGAIELRLSRDTARLHLTVTDDGGGMAEEYVPHAFDRFSRENESRTTGGAGLGLSIVAAVVDVSGGTVGLVNDPGAGLRVEITFPLVASSSERRR
ncbi:sensor histidine kinase [Microbacterium sp.]|uniref:sensor histidine kinase n=1 Tax=Microbacterium sp. TaxID=51671 RepID=UPI003F7023BE